MLKTTIGQLLVNETLPDDLRDYGRVLDKKGISDLLGQVAERYPDRYREISHKLMTVGRESAYRTGGMSFGVKHLRVPAAALKVRQGIEKQVEQILESQPDSPERDQAVIEVLRAGQKTLAAAVYEAAKADDNPLARQVLSGARGNPTQLNRLLGGDLLYVDQHDNEIPVPVTHSYSEGLLPVEWFAGSFGGRKGTIDTKMSTANSGWLAKQLTQAAHRLMVTERDADEPGLDTPIRGLPVSIDDKDNEGALLARETGGYPRNTPLTPKILGALRSKGIQHLLVRSPLVGGPRSGGVYSQDVGVRERGGLPTAGDMVGIAAAQALSEKLTQGALGSKHSGGVAGAAASVSGFPLINQFVQVPEVFPGGAVHSQLDGIVSRIEPAAAGGYDVYIDNEKHYVGPGYELKVKPKQEVEAGDVLTNGIPSPAEIVWHKGVGEGRRYFTDALQKAYQDSGMRAHRRNVELVARGLIDHVRLNEEYGQHFPDDVVSYSQLEHSWQPREGTQRVNLSSARGKYLERPVLHYSIGTKVRPSVIKQLQQFGVGQVDVHDSPPPFQPEMIPGRYNLLNDPDWLTRMYGSNLSKGLLQSVHRGATSDAAGTSFVPALAEGTTFGKTWPALPKPKLPKPPGSLL